MLQTNGNAKVKSISVIIPVYNEKDNVRELYTELKEVLSYNYAELIFIDDGSSDGTDAVLRELKQNDDNVHVIKFNRHLGKSEALSSGFKYASGDYVITMDGDLQDDPKEIPDFLNEIEKGNDMVVGWKFIRKDPITKRIPSKIFNRLTAFLTGVKIHDFNCCFKIYKKEVVKNLRIYGELHRYIPALAYWKGYNVGEMKINHRPRKHGKTKYGAMRLVTGFLDLITIKFIMSYAKRPFHLFGFAGLSLTGIGFISGVYLLYAKYVLNELIGGRPLLFLTMLLVFLGIQLFSIGIIGEILISKNGTD